MVLRKMHPLALATLVTPLLLNACGMSPDTTPPQPAPRPEAGVDAVVDVGSQNFENATPDAGLPAGFVEEGAVSATWNVLAEGSNDILEASQGVTGGAAEFVMTGSTTWADQTIQVKVRLTDDVGGSAQICGRFNPPKISTAYCLDISADGSGTNTGSMYIVKRSAVGSTPLSSVVSELPITLGTWHTYRFSISGGTTVQLNAYLDDAAKTATATATDSADSYKAGAVALGVRDIVTADFDDLNVTVP